MRPHSGRRGRILQSTRRRMRPGRTDGEHEVDLICNLLDRTAPGESPVTAVEYRREIEREPTVIRRPRRDLPGIEADFMGHLTDSERPRDAVMACRLVERLNTSTGEGHRRVVFDIEEIGR